MPDQQPLIAIDASTEQCSLSILHQEQIFSRSDFTPKSHAKVLLPMLDSLVGEAKVTLDSVAAIGVCIGPGSFTGIRIALSVAQGLGYGLNIPLIGFHSQETLAKSFQLNCDEHIRLQLDQATLVTALDARMGEVYWAAFRLVNGALIEVSAPTVSQATSLNQFLLQCEGDIFGCGHGWKVSGVNRDRLKACFADVLPEASAILALLNERGLVTSSGFQNIEPLYLRNEVSWDKRKRIRSKPLV